MDAGIHAPIPTQPIHTEVTLPPKPRRSLVALLLVLFLLTACLGGRNKPVLGDATLLAGAATLTCSQACADQGQCGDSPDRGQVVLLHTSSPATQNHDLAVSVSTGVDIMQSAPLAALRLSNLEEVQVMFYFVNIPDRQTQAWVPGWCIQGTAAPEPTPAP